MDFGDDQEGSDSQRRRKRYHRHTPRQIQQLEAMFKECPHPDENQRAQLSRELGLEQRQIKFWFQNRRTQMKAQHERADNCFLRADNDKIRCENIAMREALKNVICPTCGGPPVAEDYFDEQKLRMENARLKEELDRMSNLTSKYLGRPFTQMPPVTPMSVSSLDLSVGGMGGPALGGPSLDLDLLSGGSSGMPFQLPAPVSDMERPMMADTATRAMDELIRLAQAGDHVWVNSPGGDGRETLNVDTYDSIFSKPGSSFRAPDINVEGSRDSGLVFMSAVALVDVFMDSSKWMEFFPSIVSKARTIEFLVNGMTGRSESLILMYEELHIMSPVVPTREFSFLRYCRQIEQGLWAIADVSVDLQRDAHFGAPPRSRRLPSGCLIADMSNGYSKGDLGRTHGDGEGPDQLALPRPRAERRSVRGAPVARRAAARVRAVRVPHDARRATPRHGRSDAGREAQHDEAVAEDGEQLLREPERVAPPPVDDAVGLRRGERARLHAPQLRSGPAQRRRAQRRHLHLAARPLRPRLRLRPRRERALPVGRPIARQSGPGSVAHPQRLESRQLHLLAKRSEREPEQHADPAGELHGRVGVAGGVLADRPPGGQRRDERRGPVEHSAAAVGLHHPARRAAGRRVHQRHPSRGPDGLRRHRRLPDPRQQPAVVQAQRRVRRHGQWPHQHHRAADQGRPQLLRSLIHPSH